jgi:hypothetical protein
MKAKPILVIIVTLIIGFLLGMLTSAQIRYHKLKPVRVYFSEGRFREGFYETIQPDEQQKANIDIVLDKYAKINSDLQTDFRNELDATMKAFRKELDSHLTKEQLARLKEMDERRQAITREYRRNRENDSINGRNDGRHEQGRRPPPDGMPSRRPNGRDTISLPDSE